MSFFRFFNDYFFSALRAGLSIETRPSGCENQNQTRLAFVAKKYCRHYPGGRGRQLKKKLLICRNNGWVMKRMCSELPAG